MMPRYAVLAARIRQELRQLERIVSRVDTVMHSNQRFADPTLAVESIVLNLQSFYTGTERIFQAIASAVDGSLPQGVDWHRQLLLQMTVEVGASRPAVIKASTAKALDEYLRFRHVVRNLYAFEFEPERVRSLAKGLRDAHAELGDDLDAFATFLEYLAMRS